MKWGAMGTPVRICLGAAIVANLLLLSCTVGGIALPENSTDRGATRDVTNKLALSNKTISRRNRQSDIENELLQPKDAQSEDNADKNKLKTRGRVRFTKSSTPTPYRRVRTTSTTEKPVPTTKKTPNIIIVTPTPEVKKPSQIIDSMMRYKRKKIESKDVKEVKEEGSIASPSKSEKKEKIEVSSNEEYSSEEHEEDDDNFEKFTSSKFDSNFFTIPGYDDNIGRDSKGSEKRTPNNYDSSAFSTFSNYFPEIGNVNDFHEQDEPYKHDDFFNFDEELTTPKNDFFDKKHKQISQSIIKNLDYIKSKAKPPNATSIKIANDKEPLVKANFTTPTNKSTILIRNTKEIRLMDNDGADTNNKALSDIHGTSVYYEMSVLSTETYNIDQKSDDDCDDAVEPTQSTLEEVELGSLNLTQLPVTVKNQTILNKSYPDPVSDSQNYLPFSTLGSPFFDSPSPVSYSAQNIVTSTEKTSHTYSSGFSRQRNYSKRLQSAGSKDSSNNVTPKSEDSTSRPYRGPSRRFHYTTPKTKPIWMAPRRNSTRNSYNRSTVPTTIFSEYFDISDKFSTSTPKPRPSSKLPLTTVESEIDPVLQTDIGGVSKVVHSKPISDNSIPSLWKRGSTKFSSSPATTTEVLEEMEIPPTLTAWALASLKSPPSMASSTQKEVDENELQKEIDNTDKKETTTSSSTTSTTTSTTTSSTTTTTPIPINNEIISEKITKIGQNKWRPSFPRTTTSQKPLTVTDSKSVIPAESNISIQSSTKGMTTTQETSTTEQNVADEMSTGSGEWINVEETPSTKADQILPVDATKSTGFESITKLPSGLTTPHDETSESQEEVTQMPTTTDYKITTIRFSYELPTENTETSAPEDTSTDSDNKTSENDNLVSTKDVITTWHPVFPTRTNNPTTIKDVEITTYRPKYITTTELIEESEPTTIIPETTSQLEVSSQVLNNITEKEVPVTTVAVEVATEIPTDKPGTTTEVTEETTTVIVQIATEINTQRTPITSSVETITSSMESTEPSSSQTESSVDEKITTSSESSESNEVITQETSKIQPITTPEATTVEIKVETDATTSEFPTRTEETKTESTEPNTTIKDDLIEVSSTTETGTKSVNELEDLTSFNEEVTTEASSRVLTDEAGTGAAIAIAVSTIGVIALILLVGLLLVVRRRGRRGVYAQRCTPVSLDAYSLDSVSVGHRKGNHRLRSSKRSYGNPAYDDEVTSHPMQYAALANFALDIESISAEFAEIPSVSVRPDEVPPGCEDKNRYSNVLPLPETRVPLKRIGNDPATEYINANFITGPGNIRNYYIACQAPLPNTVVDFWRMVWEQNSRVIVMLTEYMENGVEKCYEYLPPSEVSDNKRIFGDFHVILMKREQRDKYAVSSVQLLNMETRTWREVTQLWYFWPAKGVPDDYESVLDFLSEMRSYMKLSQTAKEYDMEGVEVIYGDQSRSSFHNLSKLRSDDNSSGNGVNVYSPAKAEEQLRRGNVTNGTLSRMKAASEVEGVRPCVVTCASGAGRSAALIAADICARALAAAATDVPRVVREIRAQRPHSLTNRHHYIFLYKLLSEYGNKLMGGGVDTI